MVPPQKNIFLLLYCIIFDNKFLLILRNSKLLSINFLCVTLSHMSICTWVVISVALQEVDNAPNAKTGSESDNKCLQYVYCAVEKCHIKLLSAAIRLPEKGHKKRRSVLGNCRGHKSPRCVCCCCAAVFSCRVRLPAAIRARSRSAHHVARVYCFYFKLPPFQKVVCRQA